MLSRSLEEVFALLPTLSERRNQIARGAKFQSIDARLAYWVIQSSAQLVTRAFLQIDSSTEAARDWMMVAMHNHDLDGMFGPSGVSRSDATAALATLDARTGTLYDAVLLRLKKDIGSLKPQKVDPACVRVTALNDFFDDRDDNRLGEYDGPHGNVLGSSILGAVCLARQIRRDAASGKPVQPDEGDLADAVIQRIKDQIDRAKAMGKWPDLQKEASSRAAELAAVAHPIPPRTR